MESYKIILKKIKPQKIASLRGSFKVYCEAWSLWDKLSEYMKNGGIRAAAAPLTIFHDPGNQDKGEKMDVETAVVVDKLFPGNESVSVYELPETEMMACTVHKGEVILEACSIGTKKEEPIDKAYAALKEWIKNNDYRITGPGREVYLRSTAHDPSDPTVHPDCVADNPLDNATEIQFPVEKV